MTTVDLDKLEALEKRATRGEWNVSAYHMAAYGAQISDADIRFIVAVRNAFPELLSEVRELRGIAEAARETSSGWDEDHPLVAALARYDAGGTQ